MTSPKQELAKSLLIDLLSDEFELEFKKMFGAYGVYANEKLFFAVLADGVIFFRTDETLAREMIALGAKKLEYLKNYYSLSNSILADDSLIKTFARRSVAVCLQGKPREKKMSSKEKNEFLGKVKLRRTLK